MTILYVDMEHDRVVEHPELGPAHRVKVDATRERLATAAAEPCQSLRYAEVSPTRVERLAPTAVVIGGCTTDWGRYDFAALAGLLATIRTAPVPILGICGGHQLIGFAHAAPWGPLGPLDEGEVDPDPRFVPGRRKERGFLTVAVDARCPLFRDLAPTVGVFQSHYWELTEVPRGFVARAWSAWSPIQAIERLDRPVFGVQFHPERDDAEHANGAVVLRNFFAVVREQGTGTKAER